MTGGRVVVLGPTGRNFAAGMSGGLAFVLDEDGTFAGRVNPAMRDQLEPLDEGDAIEVRALVAEHAERTGSPVAQRGLDEWDDLLPSFVKVYPTDYKRVLAELETAEAASSNGSSNGAVAGAAKKVV
jgi:glutamate synthase domain-containing protein 3